MSFHCAKRGAKVTASDISLASIENLQQNEKELSLNVDVVHSDLFDSISEQFDLILINPPYYPRNPTNEEEKAWFCEEDFEYFKKLAKQLKAHLTADGFALIILSEDCEIRTIKQLFKDSETSIGEVLSATKYGEQNFIYQLN